MFFFGRRLLSGLLCIVVMTGALVHAAHAAQADVALATMAMAAEAAMPDKGSCDGCCDDQGRPSPEHPAIAGITLPGMPEGSPGMSGRKSEPFTIYAVTKDGTPPKVYAVE
jgi:Protein of unknown function, DUF